MANKVSSTEVVMSDSSFVLSFSGCTTDLESHIFPPIELSPEKNYVIGLVELLTFNSIPNIDEDNNKFYIVDSEPIIIPTGSYEIEHIEEYLKPILEKLKIIFSLKANNNTLKSVIECSKAIDFQPSDSIARLLGFTPQVLEANKTHISNLPVSILKINSLRVDCNVVAGSFVNGQRVHTLHEFFPAVPPGYKIIEKPTQVIYLPLTTKKLENVQIRVNQDGGRVNFRGEIISVRLHIKEGT